ncbi:MAG TPA: error-prone DNA polymerase [Burkholderiaceae bacterium]|nr:error-prone DNA polymerase [Burkholderiaceae bacterium]
MLVPYAELHALSNFSFQRGASHPAELVRRAHELGYAALALTDECSLAGVVRAYQAWKDLHAEAKEHGQPEPSLRLLVGSEFRVEVGARAGGSLRDEEAASFRLVVLAHNRDGYAHLCEFITRLRRASPEKGRYRLRWEQVLPARLRDCEVLLVPDRRACFEAVWAQARWLRRAFGGQGWLAVELLREADDAAWLQQLREVGRLSGVPLVAAGDVHLHVRSRKPLQDVLTAIRLGRPVRECGTALQPNAERHLRTRLRLAQIYPADLLEATLVVASKCTFSLGELSYEYPEEVVPPGETPASYLRRATYEGAQERYPEGVPCKVREQIEKELALIAAKNYEKYFLTVYDIVRHARKVLKILCQGRGSAANSAVCYCLGITEVNPAESNTLFERFISLERDEPPDIDVDFEHQRREEVIQHLYQKYGRERTALTATVISYRMRSAIRDVGKALGFDEAQIDALAKSHYWWDSPAMLPARLAEQGLDPGDVRVRQWIELTWQLRGFPRHLSQHTGGFVIARGKLSQIVPIENAAMPDRTVIEWDKDDLDTLGLMKVDVLALGMLSAIRRSLEFISLRTGRPWRMQDVPRDDPATYEMICRADTIGVFQIESRAQQSMLPRLKPRRFYDLVVEVAIVRPGPIQGGMVHPYLQRREEEAARLARGEGPLPIEDERLQNSLGRTLGVPIFQEQVMQLCMDCADFTPGEADRLRRSMAAWRRDGDLRPFQNRIIERMQRNGYSKEFAERICKQIEGFGEYGFPESHAASFAALAYVSSWIKCHEPAAFLAGLLNSQPMGFYSPSQLVQDARRHGVEVRPVDVQASEVDCTLEDLERTPPDRQPPVRLGLRLVRGLSEAAAGRIVRARQAGPFSDVQDLARRAGLQPRDLKLLAGADALASLAGHRRQQMWEAAAWQPPSGLLAEAKVQEAQLELLPAPEGEEIVFDYASLGLTLRRHPLALLRPRLAQHGLLSSRELQATPHGRRVRTCGIVTMRQQPGTANGTIFVSLEDEHGAVNVIVWPRLRERQRQPLLESRLMVVTGTWQREKGVHHLIAERLEDRTTWLGRLGTTSRDFH